MKAGDQLPCCSIGRAACQAVGFGAWRVLQMSKGRVEGSGTRVAAHRVATACRTGCRREVPPVAPRGHLRRGVGEQRRRRPAPRQRRTVQRRLPDLVAQLHCLRRTPARATCAGHIMLMRLDGSTLPAIFPLRLGSMVSQLHSNSNVVHVGIPQRPDCTAHVCIGKQVHDEVFGCAQCTACNNFVTHKQGVSPARSRGLAATAHCCDGLRTASHCR